MKKDTSNISSFLVMMAFMWPYALISGIILKSQDLKYKLENRKINKQK